MPVHSKQRIINTQTFSHSPFKIGDSCPRKTKLKDGFFFLNEFSVRPHRDAQRAAHFSREGRGGITFSPESASATARAWSHRVVERRRRRSSRTPPTTTRAFRTAPRTALPPPPVSSSPEPIAGGPSTADSRGPGRDGVRWGVWLGRRKRSLERQFAVFEGAWSDFGKMAMFFLWTAEAWVKEKNQTNGGEIIKFRWVPFQLCSFGKDILFLSSILK